LVPRSDHWSEAAALKASLISWAARQQTKPVLLVQTDGDLLFVSRHRDELARYFTFDLPAAELIENLVDKGRFQQLALDVGIDVPRAVVRTRDGRSPPLPAGPVIVKPLLRRDLSSLDDHGKAVRADESAVLAEVLDRATDQGIDVVVQEYVPGPETRVESWHAYLDAEGVVGEFCGEKIRTWPIDHGHSTALRVTDHADVRAAGRDVVGRIALRGLVKVDFKRDPGGRLRVLEVNPRATLWHHPGAIAGVNLAALAYADLAGLPRPPIGPLRTGVTWCTPREDRWAARALGVSTLAWILQTARADARSGAGWTDPLPFVLGEVLPSIARRVPGVRRQPAPPPTT
jgi:predicted ATP-grasp superfamily ATP-dependent carboligase